MFLQRILSAAFLAPTLLAMTLSIAAQAAPTVTISNNPGGNIAVFALSAAEYRNTGTLVKFTGNCDSACTLFLGLPSHQTCVTSGASFRFHAPFGVSGNSQKIAQAYLMRKYPGWVRSWIDRNNGLTRQLITMDYGYAKKFMRTCDSA
jgi:hypothetical protein